MTNATDKNTGATMWLAALRPTTMTTKAAPLPSNQVVRVGVTVTRCSSAVRYVGHDAEAVPTTGSCGSSVPGRTCATRTSGARAARPRVLPPRPSSMTAHQRHEGCHIARVAVHNGTCDGTGDQYPSREF